MQLNWNLSFIRPQASLGVALETRKYHHWDGPSNLQQHGFIRSSISSYPHIEPPARPPGLLIRKRLSKKKKVGKQSSYFREKDKYLWIAVRTNQIGRKEPRLTLCPQVLTEFSLYFPHTGNVPQQEVVKKWPSEPDTPQSELLLFFYFTLTKLKKELTCSEAREPKDLWQRLTSIKARVKLPK